MAYFSFAEMHSGNHGSFNLILIVHLNRCISYNAVTVTPTDTDMLLLLWAFFVSFIHLVAEQLTPPTLPCSYVLAQASCMHIYMKCLHQCTLCSVSILLLPVMFFILLYMMLYKHISYHKIPFCTSLRNKCLVSFYFLTGFFLVLQKMDTCFMFPDHSFW